MEHRRFWKIGTVLLAALLLSSCQQTSGDPDGVREGANDLPLQYRRSDALTCRGDCADWYRTRVSGGGTFVVDVKSTASSKSASSFHVELQSESGRRLDSKLGTPGKDVQVRAPVSAGSVYTVVKVGEGDLGYTIRARLLAGEKAPPPKPEAPPPPRVRYHDVTASIIEVEGHGDRQKVLIDKGTSQGIRAGQRGSLKDGGRTLAEFEVIEVFAEGSRARLMGEPSGVIKASTRAVVRVPVR